MLHIVNKSPFERNNFDSCLKKAKEGSAILLYEDGVIGALAKTTYAAKIEAAIKNNIKVFALEPDLKARGFTTNIVEGVETVNYEGFVDLTVEYGTVTSWL